LAYEVATALRFCRNVIKHSCRPKPPERVVDANFELVFSKLGDSGKSVIYTRIDSDKSAITGSATYQIWFRLPNPNHNPYPNSNPNPKSNNNLCSTERH